MSTKPSLYNATRHLIDLMERIDNSDDLTTELINEFSSAKLEVSEAIDRRRFVMSECDSRIEAAKKMTMDIKDHIKRLEKVKERIKSTTLSAMQKTPNTSFRDSLGRELKIKTTAGKLKIKLDTKKITVDHCCDTSLITRDDVMDYIVPRTYYILDVAKIKKDLDDGIEINFASIEYNEYLKGL